MSIRNYGFLGVLALAAGLGCSSLPKVPPIACNQAAIPYFQLLYPIPGATAVPTAAGSLVFAGPPDAAIVVSLAAPGLTTRDLGPLLAAPSPLPSPMASPNVTASPLSSAPYPALAAATTYSVSYKVSANGPCSGQVVTAGTFTTE